jgi:hypothetical protein
VERGVGEVTLADAKLWGGAGVIWALETVCSVGVGIEASVSGGGSTSIVEESSSPAAVEALDTFAVSVGRGFCGSSVRWVRVTGVGTAEVEVDACCGPWIEVFALPFSGLCVPFCDDRAR